MKCNKSKGKWPKTTGIFQRGKFLKKPRHFVAGIVNWPL